MEFILALAFLVDEHVNPRVIQALHDNGVTAISVHDLGLANQGFQDDSLLALAVERHETLLTLDEDFPSIHAKWLEDGKSHYGIFFGATRKFQHTGAIGILVRFCVDWSKLIEEGAGTLEEDIYNQLIFIKE
jgi:hypothetical protein